jgi:hypothetical protein
LADALDTKVIIYIKVGLPNINIMIVWSALCSI